MKCLFVLLAVLCLVVYVGCDQPKPTEPGPAPVVGEPVPDVGDVPDEAPVPDTTPPTEPGPSTELPPATPDESEVTPDEPSKVDPALTPAPDADKPKTDDLFGSP